MDPLAFAKTGATTKQRRISFIIFPDLEQKTKKPKKHLKINGQY